MVLSTGEHLSVPAMLRRQAAMATIHIYELYLEEKGQLHLRLRNSTTLKVRLTTGFNNSYICSFIVSFADIEGSHATEKEGADLHRREAG